MDAPFSSPKKHAVRPTYSIETAVATVAQPNTVFAGAQPPLKTFFVLNLEFETHDPDGSVFETWKIRMRPWRHSGPSRGRQGNNRGNGSDNGCLRYANNRGHNSIYQSNSSGITRAHTPIGVRNFSHRPTLSTPHHAPSAHTPTTRYLYAPTLKGLQNANNHQHVPPYRTAYSHSMRVWRQRNHIHGAVYSTTQRIA